MEDGYFKIGNVLSPLSASSTNSLLQDVDPAVFYLLDFFAKVLKQHMGARFDQCAAAVGRSDLIGQVVANSIPFDPSPFLQDTQYDFPLLCIFRQSSKYEHKTQSHYAIRSKLALLYILPPFSAGQFETMHLFRVAAQKVLHDRGMQGFDDNVNNGASFAAAGGMQDFEMNGDNFGNFPDPKSEMYMPTLMIDLGFAERSEQDIRNFSPLAGIDNSINVA